jgi:ribosome biogenesis GTPase
MFIVMGLDDDYNPRRLERYLTMVSGSGAKPVVILNKADIAEDLEDKMYAIGKITGEVPVHSISALKGDGLDIIREYLGRGVTIALVGSSGVGKSTLINSLIGDSIQKTGAVREKDSKGRHVTTSRELMVIPGGGMIIDNPGIREIQLWGDETSIEMAFADIAELALSCRFKDCSHIKEPGCNVKKAIEKGTLDEKRYQNYIKMKKELRNLEIRSSKSSEAAEKEKWRPIMKGMKKYFKYKKGE